MTDTTTIPEPNRTVTTGRAIAYRWDLDDAPDDRGATRHIEAELRCQHHGKPDYGVRTPYSFTAELDIRETTTHADGHESQTFRLANSPYPRGVVVAVELEVRRFSEVGLQRFAAAALRRLDPTRPEVAAIFAARIPR